MYFGNAAKRQPRNVAESAADADEARISVRPVDWDSMSIGRKSAEIRCRLTPFTVPAF